MFEAYSATSHPIGGSPYLITYRNTSSATYWCSTNNNPNVTFRFQHPVLITSYSLENARNDSAVSFHSYPTKISLYGSNDNSTWHILDTQENLSFCSTIHCRETVVKDFPVLYPNY